MSRRPFRDRILARLIEDLVGPLTADEILSDRPTQRYSTGILYPRDSRIETQENEDGGLAVNEVDDTASAPEEAGTSLHAALKPSVAGVSFAVRPLNKDGTPIVEIAVSCAIYKRFSVSDAGDEVEGNPPDRAHERWRRIPLHAQLSVGLRAGESRIDLGDHGMSGLELYILTTPHADVITVTAALSNRRSRGDSSAYDEEQHFFQVELSLANVSKGAFAPRPSWRAQTDDDGRTAALIYREVQEYVVGHTCSARALLHGGGVAGLKTEWVPTAIVPGVSDRGDAVFEPIRNDEEDRPLEAKWLAEASRDVLAVGLGGFVDAYREWIRREEQRIPGLAANLQPQARKHIERCRHGAERIAEGVDALRDDVKVCTAFQLAQTAMLLQFGWLRNGAPLVWHPFQLAFQLLVLASLATRSHTGRETMDLLWFPTGGGKTEAYLALTAFVILLRRLRGSAEDDGAGVAVLMRYTLRLLTVQQFQRAAAMICACELLRRRGESRVDDAPDLGKTPIGIGLWVGAAATPLTLKDALNRAPTYQFPSPGLDAGNSGFAVTDSERPGRLYVGLTTAGRSATYVLQALVASLLQAASEPGASEEERDYYWTLVTYFNSLRELGRALVLMQDDVPVSIAQFASRRGEVRRRLEAPAELTSRVRSYEIRDMLDLLSKSAGDSEAVDLLVASNMISVGMDIPRLGLMVVNAQPKTVSEYIQATSRVGRGAVPGIVITMYNSMRARDRSHYETFETWHRCLYRDVEATSVTPFASRAQDKALHAVLVALVRHTVPGMDRRPVLDGVRRTGAERIAGLIEGRVARIDPTERAIVSQKLKQLIDQWASRSDLQTYWDDYERRTSLLMSAEQFAAKADVDADLDPEGARRALWPTPNSMREVEAGAPFVLRHVLKAEGS